MGSLRAIIVDYIWLTPEGNIGAMHALAAGGSEEGKDGRHRHPRVSEPTKHNC